MIYPTPASMNFTFSTQDLVAICTLVLGILSAIWITWRSLNKKIEDAAKSADTNVNTLIDKLDKKFEDSSKERQDQFYKLEATIERNRVEVTDRTTALRDLVHQESGTLHERIDDVKTAYARREDIVALTTAITTLNGRIDLIITSLANKVAQSG